MTIKHQDTNINVATFCGIVDVYDDEITSFTMVDDDTLNVKHRIVGALTKGYNISVV